MCDLYQNAEAPVWNASPFHIVRSSKKNVNKNLIMFIRFNFHP